MENSNKRQKLDLDNSSPTHMKDEVVPKSAIEKLPTKILLKIFENCLNTSGSSWEQQCDEINHPDDDMPDYSIKAICMNLRQIRLVCNRFNDVSKDATLIKKLIINHEALKNKKNADYILDTIFRSKGLTHLYINISTNERDSLVLFAIQSCPKLSHLFINGSEILTSTPGQEFNHTKISINF